MFTGCIEEEQKSKKTEEPPEIKMGPPSILPDWKDGEYHDYYDTIQMLINFNENYPDLVNVFSIGESVLGKDIWCIRITNEKNNEVKSSCLLDGCIHGDEWEGGEACLYLAEYLLINFDTNKTVTDILNTSEVYIVPLVNPDGRQDDTRWNDNGVDLNRNFDVWFGKLRAKPHMLRLGKLFGRIKIPYIRSFSDDPYKWFWNCGRRPFSEPETQALRDLMRELKNNDFSFYVDCHTATHAIVASWITFKPPFEMTQRERNVIEYVLDWVEVNTEYEAFRTEGEKTGGFAMDWCFKESRIPSFGFEILTVDYDPWIGEKKHDHLVHWMETTLPVFMYLLVNIDNLRQWRTPDIQPPLPEGVPPQPLHEPPINLKICYL